MDDVIIVLGLTLLGICCPLLALQTAVTMARHQEGNDADSPERVAMSFLAGLFWPVVLCWVMAEGLVQWFTVPEEQQARWGQKRHKKTT
ncbi:MAG TPA: hypothetical protein VJB57_07110 [Dehalococcoidia bacterium]|nr:hypothetical protein [Dehalococcoidia bacterium]